MAQYDVFPNPSRSAADGIPYVVVIQSDSLDALATRLTMPLAQPDTMGKVPTVLCPTIHVNGQAAGGGAQRGAGAEVPDSAQRGFGQIQLDCLGGASALIAVQGRRQETV